MRDIKFRFWDEIEEKWLDNIVMVDIDGQCRPASAGSEKDSWPIWVRTLLLRTKIQQFTGFKDKHGKEIYEGDFLSYLERDGERAIGVVKFQDGMWACYNMPLYDSVGFDSVEDEVCGNIFENPEFLDIITQ